MMYSFQFNDVLLPVTPSKLQLKITNKNSTMTLINEGEINLLKTPGLTDISFEIMLPHTAYPFAVYADNKYLPIPYFLDLFKKLKINKEPFRFIVSRFSPSGEMQYENNIKVSLEEYTVTDDAKEGFDVVVSIKLKEYRDFVTKVVNTEKVNGTVLATFETQRAVAPATKNVTSHTVIKGDTLWSICKKNIGDGSKCYEIAKLNSITDANKIYPGQVIKFG